MHASSIPIPLPRPAAASDGGFFAHHGLWAPGVRLFRQLRFASKAAIISLAFLLPTLGLLGWQLLARFDETMAARIDATRQHVEIVHGLVSTIQAQEASGALTRAQAQALAIAQVKALRYDGREYFWINDMQPRMVMHPMKPALDGQDLSGNKDPNGFALFNAFVATVRDKGQGVVAYQWPKPGQDKPVDKISYVMGFSPWGWVLGSGVYVDDLRATLVHNALVEGSVVLAATLLAGYCFFSFYKVMDGGLKETRRHMQAITAGDLTTTPSPWGRDEAAQLMLELRRMQESLREMVAHVKSSSEEILRSSGEIASGAMDLSSRTEQAAANLEQSSASMEQIGATVRSTSDHAAEASRVAEHNASRATEGGRVMGDVITTMDGIRDASKRIADIIGTIDGIAFQTNILALNAAVEAARAGEQGRGFAVVASEVRSLAQRSAAAAREIKGLIGHSVDQVEAGTAVVRRAGTTIEDIVTSSHRVNQLLGQIATGSREQTAGVAQIGQGVQELDRMTQQNAALVEQTAAAAGSMNGQARTLAGLVARFRLPG
jgi:methyl-accepting chemotaxis protein